MAQLQVVMNPLGDFITKRTSALDMSVRKLAEEVGCSHSTLLGYMGDDQKNVKIDMLAEIARVLNADLCSVVMLMKPEETRLSPQIIEIADRLTHLSPENLERLDNEIIGLVFKSRQKGK